MGKDVIIACDFKNKEELFKFLEPFKGLNPFLKIGMETRDFAQIEQIKTALTEAGFKIV